MEFTEENTHTLVHTLIEQTAAKYPKAIAISVPSKNVQISFSQLDKAANNLATRILQVTHGVLETPVALFFSSKELYIISSLAVWKSGGAFVPISPTTPRGRLLQILEELGPSALLLTDPCAEKSLHSGENGITLPFSVITVEEDNLEEDDLEEICSLPEQNRAIIQDNLEKSLENQGSRLAYIIFTSGSTGRPKGVMIEHHSLLHLLREVQQNYPILPGDNVALCADSGFDASILDTFLPLGFGGCVVIPSDDVKSDPRSFLEFSSQHRITRTFLTTPIAEIVCLSALEMGWSQPYPSVIFMGGTALAPLPFTKLPFRILHIYGTTETTIFMTWWMTGRNTDGGKVEFPTPIGHAFGKTEIHITPEDGELWVGGPQLARGYWKQPALTGEKFVHDETYGRRWYRTGDWVEIDESWPERPLVWKGRFDDQIKLGGYRVEPAEVEAALTRQNGIKLAKVIKVKERLLAFLVPEGGNNGQEIEKMDLAANLKNCLPHYMIPSQYILLQRFPLTVNGKIDKDELLKLIPAPTPVIVDRNGNEVAVVKGNKKLPIWEGFRQRFESCGKDPEARKDIVNQLILALVNDLQEMDEGEIELDSEIGHFCLNSLTKIKLVSALNRALFPHSPSSTRITYSTIDGSRTVREMGEEISKNLIESSNQARQLELNNLIRQDAILPESIVPNPDTPPVSRPSEIRVALLTGANGNLGPYVLQELLSRPAITRVVCIIRGRRGQSPKERLQHSLQTKEINFKEENWAKIQILNGDITLEKLGLDKEIYLSIAKEVDAIFHVAVLSNYLEDYKVGIDTRTVNTIGLLNVLRFSIDGKTKYFSHSSSLAATLKGDGSERAPEDWPSMDEFDGGPHFGYAIAKFVQELLLKEAVQRGLPVKVFRYQIIAGHSITGNYDLQENYFYLRYLFYLRTGLVPDFNHPIWAVPVDLCASLSTQIFFNESAPSGVYNVYNPHNAREEEMLPLLQEFGFGQNSNPPRICSYSEFVGAIDEEGEGGLLHRIGEFYKSRCYFDFIAAMSTLHEWENNPREYYRSQKLLEYIGEEGYLKGVEHPIDIVRRDLKYALAQQQQKLPFAG